MVKNRSTEKGRFNFLIDSSVYKEFSKICKDMGIIRSKVVENHMKSFAADPESATLRREKTQKKGRYNFLVDSSAYREFSEVCDDLGLVRSKNIENFMRDFIDKNK